MRKPSSILLILIAFGLALASCGLFRSPEAANRQHVARPQKSNEIEVIWVGHATALVRLGEIWVLTDPVFSERVGVVYKRYVKPGRDLQELPKIDAIALSHPHLDHLDSSSLKAIVAANPSIPILGSKDTLKHLPKELRSNAVTLSTWQESQHGSLRVSLVPAHHGNGRWGLDGIWNKHAAAGFVLENKGHTVYFAGDTGYHAKTFKEIGSRFKIDVAILPVGPAGRPDWVHKLRESVHASPSDAFRIFSDLEADYMVPVHFGTFFKKRSEEIADIRNAITKSGKQNQVALMSPGESVAFVRSDYCPPRLSCIAD